MGNVYQLDRMTLLLAVEIADRTARTDIESCTLLTADGWLDIHRVALDGTTEEREIVRGQIAACMAYIELRGDQLDYRVVRNSACPNLIRFEARV